MQQIQRGIFFEDSFLGVTLGGLVFTHGTILIDAPLRAEDARSWRSALLNQRGGATRVLVNLDPHPDRTLGDRALDTTILAHAKTAQIFRNRPTIFKGQATSTGAAWESYNDAVGMRWANPDITFTDSISLFWGGPEVVLEQRDGPAPGAIWIRIPNEKVVFVGDAVVMNQPPFLAHADLPAWLDSLALLQRDYADYTVVSGRGGLASAKDILAMQAILQSISERLDSLAANGEPPESTEDLVAELLSSGSYPIAQNDTYARRLRYGLHQYYNRRYRSVSPPDLIEEENNE